MSITRAWTRLFVPSRIVAVRRRASRSTRRRSSLTFAGWAMANRTPLRFMRASGEQMVVLAHQPACFLCRLGIYDIRDTTMLLIALLIPLSLAILVYALVLTRAAIAARAKPTLEALALGAVVNFFDTFGISSFAQTTAWMKFRKMVPDRLIPPTMIAGLTPPAMVESIIFLILLGVRVDPVLL